MRGYITKPKHYCLTPHCTEETDEGINYCQDCNQKHVMEMKKRRLESIRVDDEGKHRMLTKNIKRYKKCHN